MTADTIVPDPSNPQSYNRYTYAYNNAVNHVDPSGHSPELTPGIDGDGSVLDADVPAPSWWRNDGYAVALACPECTFIEAAVGSAVFEVFSLPERWRENVSITSENDVWVKFYRVNRFGGQVRRGNIVFRVDMAGWSQIR